MSKKLELITFMTPHHRQKPLLKQVFRLLNRTVDCHKVLDMAQAYDAATQHPYANTPRLYHLQNHVVFCVHNIGNRV
jgi:hypothetical protein